jgi:hypothetical protein
MSNLKNTIFNSINPDSLVPREKRPMPFPLENFDEEIANTYMQLGRIVAKLQAATQNPINNTPARKRRLKSLKYKANTCMKLVKEISTSCAELWF